MFKIIFKALKMLIYTINRIKIRIGLGIFSHICEFFLTINSIYKFMPENDINQILSKIIKMGDTPIHDAIISLIFTSGLKPSIFRDFKINDLIKACDDYFDEEETHDIVTLLKKDPNKIFCCWQANNNSKYQVTFSTSETTKYLFDYLKQDFDVKNLGEGDFLFRIKFDKKFRQMRQPFASDIIRRKCRRYNSHFGGKRHNIYLTPNIIIDNFKKTCNENLDLDFNDKSELIDLFLGNATEDNKFYQLFKEDKNSIFQYYKQICPHLMINEVYNRSSEELIQSTSEHSTKEVPNQYTPPNTNEDVYKHKIKDYLDNNFNFQHREGFTLQNDAKLLSYAYHLVKKDIENNKYEETEDYYDNLLKKATFYVLYRKSIDNLSDTPNFDEISPTEPQERIDMVCDYIKNMDISDFKLKDDELQNIVAYQFAFHENVMGEFNEEIFEKILVSSLFEIMKNNGMLQ